MPTLDSGGAVIVRWKRFHRKGEATGEIARQGVFCAVPDDDAGRPSRPVTLDDVARTSGVSRATASRALNGHSKVSADVRARVQLVADQLGYRPNSAARSLASGRSGVLGLVLPSGHLLSTPYEAHLLEAVADAATASGHGLMLWLAETEPGRALREGFRTGLVDGIVVSGVALGAPWVEDLFDGPHPCVLVGRHPTRTDLAYIEVDNEACAGIAVDHLVAGGGRRIATILGPQERVDARDRYVGYERALQRHGLALDTRLVERGDFSPESGYEAMRRLLAHRPDSVFACNDNMAAGALRAIAEAGLRVPDDIAVIGFDDLPIPGRFDFGISTIRQDIVTIAARAVELLTELVDGAAMPTHPITINGSLVVRGTTRPVAGVDTDAARHNQTVGVRETDISRTPVADSTSSGQSTSMNRRATP